MICNRERQIKKFMIFYHKIKMRKRMITRMTTTTNKDSAIKILTILAHFTSQLEGNVSRYL